MNTPNRAINKLSERAVRAFVSQRIVGKKLADGGGLYLILTPAGTPVWRIKYRYDGKEMLYSAGTYPAVTLEQARSERSWVKDRLREGQNPVQQRRVEKARAVSASAATFRGIADAWLEKQRLEWADVHYRKSKRALERDVFPLLGPLPVEQIKTPEIAKVIEAIQSRGVKETAVRVFQHVRCVFEFARGKGIRDDNPATPVQELLARQNEPERHHPAFIKFPELGDVLRKAETASLSPAVRLAHRLIAFTGARISNVVEAEWAQFDLNASPPVWVIPRSKMKVKTNAWDHKIFLGETILTCVFRRNVTAVSDGC